MNVWYRIPNLPRVKILRSWHKSYLTYPNHLSNIKHPAFDKTVFSCQALLLKFGLKGLLGNNLLHRAFNLTIKENHILLKYVKPSPSSH